MFDANSPSYLIPIHLTVLTLLYDTGYFYRELYSNLLPVELSRSIKYQTAIHIQLSVFWTESPLFQLTEISVFLESTPFLSPFYGHHFMPVRIIKATLSKLTRRSCLHVYHTAIQLRTVCSLLWMQSALGIAALLSANVNSCDDSERSEQYCLCAADVCFPEALVPRMRAIGRLNVMRPFLTTRQ